MADRVLRRLVLFIATLAQLGVAIAMIVFIRRVSDIDVDVDGQSISEMSCSLNAGTHSDETGWLQGLADESLCVLGYAGAAITLALMFGLSILLCLTCDLCGAGWIIEVLVQAVLCTGWVIYSIWVTKAARTIDGWETVPTWNTDSLQNDRSTIVALSWGEAILTGLVGLLILTSSCCSGRKSERRTAHAIGDSKV